jgi:hypothetical protein
MALHPEIAYDFSMRTLAKMMQLFGLAVLPLGMLMQVSGALGRDRGVADMLIMMAVGAASFYLGWVMEGYVKGGAK